MANPAANREWLAQLQQALPNADDQRVVAEFLASRTHEADRTPSSSAPHGRPGDHRADPPPLTVSHAAIERGVRAISLMSMGTWTSFRVWRALAASVDVSLADGSPLRTVSPQPITITRSAAPAVSRKRGRRSSAPQCGLGRDGSTTWAPPSRDGVSVGVCAKTYAKCRLSSPDAVVQGLRVSHEVREVRVVSAMPCQCFPNTFVVVCHTDVVVRFRTPKIDQRLQSLSSNPPIGQKNATAAATSYLTAEATFQSLHFVRPCEAAAVVAPSAATKFDGGGDRPPDDADGHHDADGAAAADGFEIQSIELLRVSCTISLPRPVEQNASAAPSLQQHTTMPLLLDAFAAVTHGYGHLTSASPSPSSSSLSSSHMECYPKHLMALAAAETLYRLRSSAELPEAKSRVDGGERTWLPGGDSDQLPKRVAVLGLGLNVLGRFLSELYDVGDKRGQRCVIDVVELEPAVVAANVVLGTLAPSRAGTEEPVTMRYHTMDVREALRNPTVLSPAEYDLVILDCFDPLAGSMMHATELLFQCRRLLRPPSRAAALGCPSMGGVLLVNAHLNAHDDKQAAVSLAPFVAAFPEVDDLISVAAVRCFKQSLVCCFQGRKGAAGGEGGGDDVSDGQGNFEAATPMPSVSLFRELSQRTPYPGALARLLDGFSFDSSRAVWVPLLPSTLEGEARGGHGETVTNLSTSSPSKGARRRRCRVFFTVEGDDT